MKKVIYQNTMPYEYDAEYYGASYYLPKINKHRNHGELCEHIAKYHRGIFTDNNPCVAFNEGSDIEEEHASVKSSRFTLAANYGNSTTISEAIKYYFKEVASSLFIYIDFNEETQIVTEYQMNKREFGKFIHYFSSARIRTNGAFEIRGRKTSKRMIQWLEAQC